MLVTKWWARDTSYFFLIFFYLRLLWVFIAAWGLSLVLASFLWGLHSGCGAWAPHCGGFSCCRAQALGHKGFKRGGTKVWLFQGMWNLPRPGIKLCSLHWQEDSYSLTTREVLSCFFFFTLKLFVDFSFLFPQNVNTAKTGSVKCTISCQLLAHSRLLAQFA